MLTMSGFDLDRYSDQTFNNLTLEETRLEHVEFQIGLLNHLNIKINGWPNDFES
jgi:hypothetical protein